MKLSGFTNWTLGIRGYYISNASTAFKKRFPKKHIVVSIERNEVFNENEIDAIPISFMKAASKLYFFTTDSKLYNSKETVHYIKQFECKDKIKRAEALKVMPSNISRYLIGGTDSENDMVIKLEPIDTITDPRLMTSIVFRCSSSMLKQSKIRDTLDKLIELGYHDFKPAKTTEEWLLMLIDDIPFDDTNSAYYFPENIDDKLFKKEFKPNLNDFLVLYSSRIPKLEDEIDLAKCLETELSSFAGEITIVNDYTNIVPRIEAACKKRKLKYKREGLAITLKMKDFYSLNLNFELINFLQ